MKTFFLVYFIILNTAWAKLPENPKSYLCEEKNPSILIENKYNLVIGVCGEKEKDTNIYNEFSIHVFDSKKKIKKPFFSNKSAFKKFLIFEKKEGFVLIEKVKVNNEFVELFRREIVCERKSCRTKKIMCLALNKIKQKWIFDNVKDKQVKTLMKKTGC